MSRSEDALRSAAAVTAVVLTIALWGAALHWAVIAGVQAVLALGLVLLLLAWRAGRHRRRKDHSAGPGRMQVRFVACVRESPYKIACQSLLEQLEILGYVLGLVTLVVGALLAFVLQPRNVGRAIVVGSSLAGFVAGLLIVRRDPSLGGPAARIGVVCATTALPPTILTPLLL